MTSTTTNSTVTLVGDGGSSVTGQVNVQTAIALVAEAVGVIGKDSKMDSGPARYDYRSLDNLVEGVHPALVRHGVTFSPEEVTIVSEDKGTTRSGGTSHHVRAIVRYRVFGPAGDSITAAVLAEAIDTSDKASSKLMSQAFKYALGQTLSIPYTGDDQDAERPEPIEAALPKILSEADTLASIETSAKMLGKTVEEVTAKVREQHGGLGPDELLEIPLPALAEFATQLSNYAIRNRRA